MIIVIRNYSLYFAVATQVASKDIWRVMGRTVNVSLYQGEPDPLQEILGHCTRENTLVLKELPDTVSDEHLSMHLERVADMTEDEDFKLDRKEDTALLKLTGSEFNSLLDKNFKVKLWQPNEVWRLHTECLKLHKALLAFFE